MNNVWVAPETRDWIVGFVNKWHVVAGKPLKWFCRRVGVGERRLLEWRKRFGKPNRPTANYPKSTWLTSREKALIVEFYEAHYEDGYRRCAYMMIDADIVAASPSSVFRALRDAGVLRRRQAGKSLKGTGFDQPNRPHEHWHTDISYVKIEKVFYYLICVLDGYSRYILSWGLRPSMDETDVGVVQQKAVELFPGNKTRYITDNGKQFVGKEFRKFIRHHGLTHVTTSPGYPQSNGKIERFHKSIKDECLNRKALTGRAHAESLIKSYVDHYNSERLHSAIGYVAPVDKLEGRDGAIKAARKRKLHEAAASRKLEWEKLEMSLTTDQERSIITLSGEAEVCNAGGQHTEE